MNPSAQIISHRLASFGKSSAFATSFTLDADPQLYVNGFGRVPLPVTVQTAHRLCAVAKPAHHGYKNQTRLDPRVRDTWEIPASQFRLDAPKWTAMLDKALLRIGRDLGIPAGGGLRAELHNVLVYAPGQFFSVHQDSEKADGMLGTLVVTLPSRFTGGEFTVSHQGETMRSRGSTSRLGLIAFYADCHHEVRAVKHGYRVVLTYNLINSAAAPAVELPAREVTALAADVRRFWQTAPTPRWPGDSSAKPPERLVYLLDHQYTASGLSWQGLKGADVPRVAALREVAQRLDAEIFLTLADVHEIWSAEEDYDRWDDTAEEDEQSPEDTARAPALDELIDSEIELRHWLATDGSKRAETSFATIAELCMNRLSKDCTPFKSEYEGYMGNYGNTVDRWYHRAAVVMWPRERAFLIRARQAPRWAMEQIAGRLKSGDVAQALDWIGRLLPDWERAVRTVAGKALLPVTLRVSAELDKAPVAAALLAPFVLQHLTAETAPWLLKLLKRHGRKWCAERVQDWMGKHEPDQQRLDWMADVLPELVRTCSTSGGVAGTALAANLAQACWNSLCRHIGQIQAHAGGSSRVEELVATSSSFLGLIYAASVTRSRVLARQILALLCSDTLPLQVPLNVLWLAKADAEDVVDRGLASLHGHCVSTLAARLAKPARARGDWSMTPPADASRLGDLAGPLQRFLASPKQQRLEWPLAQSRRQTIHRYIDHHELPVKHETRRSGSPYTLVLEKTQALFEHDAAERRQWKKDLVWLRRVAGHFA